MGDKKIYIFALAAHGEGISGGDRIFIEFARHWSKNYPVTIYVWDEGYNMCLRHKLQISNVKFQISNMKPWERFGFVVNYFARIIEGIRLGLTLIIKHSQHTVIYSASEFWMDSIPALFIKLRYPKITWAAAWFQTAPKPWIGFAWALPYWFVQLPIKPLINSFADFVLVNNEEEKKQFPRLDRLGKTIVVLGALDLEAIKKFKKLYPKPYLLNPKKYDAVFQGRFHPQKGIVELIDIWQKVVRKKKDAKLALIGDGPLMNEVKTRIKRYGLEKNIKLLGYLFDGEKKYKIFSQSKIVLHPAFYDSGGMASYEAMAFGLPCVGFNLPSYKSYYPKGMEKVSMGNLAAFATKILQLLSDKKLYDQVSKDAYQLVQNMTWDRRSRQILDQVLE